MFGDLVLFTKKGHKMQKFFAQIIDLPTAEQLEKLAEFAKDQKITLSALKASFTAFLKEKKKKAFQAKSAADTKYFQGLFKLENIILPANFQIQNGYFVYIDEKDAPLYLTKIFCISQKIYTNSNTYWLLDKADNKVEIIDSREFVKADKIAFHFADRGEVLSPQKLQKTSQFISEFLRLNEHSITSKKGFLKTGFHDGEYCLPGDNRYLFLNAELKERFGLVGTLQKQIEMMRELANGKVFLLSLFSLASVFQGLLPLPLNYICHIGGLTGEGKSFAVKTAISLFGRKDAHLYAKNWNATINGLEVYWEQMQDLPSWVDELESSKNIQETVSAMYMFSERTGKARAYVDGFGDIKERNTKSFRGHLFSTGEKSLWDVIQKVGQNKNKPLGLVRRSLDLDSVELWKGVDKKIVGDLLNANQGHFIFRFIEMIKDLDIESLYNEIAKKYKLEMDGKENLFYILILTLEILKNNKIIDERAHALQMNFIYDEITNANKQINQVQNSHELFFEELLNHVSLNRVRYRHLVDDSEIKGLEGRYKSGILSISSSVVTDLCDKYGFIRKQVLEKLVKDDRLEDIVSKNVKLMSGANPKCYNFRVPGLNMDEPETVYQYVNKD